MTTPRKSMSSDGGLSERAVSDSALDAPRGSNPDGFLLREVLDADLGSVPDVLGGVQQKLRERSGGRFYADGWSTDRHAPTSVYLLTALFMLAVCGITYVILRPLASVPDETDLTPAPVEVLGPPRRLPAPAPQAPAQPAPAQQTAPAQ